MNEVNKVWRQRNKPIVCGFVRVGGRGGPPLSLLATRDDVSNSGHHWMHYEKEHFFQAPQLVKSKP